MRDLDELAAITNEAIQIGHDILRNSIPTRVRAKGDRDFVTDIDVTIEREIHDFLHRATPEIGFLGEEEGQVGATETVWTLDPIDGTTNYIHGLPLYAVSLALVHQDQTVAAAIDAPALGLRYTATVGRGARCNGTPMQASTTADLTRAVVAIGDYAVGSGAAKKNQRRLALTANLVETVERIRMLGSAALDLACVADGKIDAAITLSNKPWDTAAGVLLVREAGGKVFDADGVPHSLRSLETVAANESIAGLIHAVLNDRLN